MRRNAAVVHTVRVPIRVVTIQRQRRCRLCLGGMSCRTTPFASLLASRVHGAFQPSFETTVLLTARLGLASSAGKSHVVTCTPVRSVNAVPFLRAVCLEVTETRQEAQEATGTPLTPGR
ncbi:hypothetical protein HPB50_003878 [Hyalomma asiaticum]|uniref:Uncharacterized protein n=1 Tax=Hyalomma asiaticum TaxID=266040 RepID=A0ACB7RQX1_HYAAI|nr:hypothetical protein HPB50_003878 [Hyalomma asiaticum]